MSLPGSHNRFNEGSYAPYQTDMWTGYVGEVLDASGHTGTVDTVHIREQTQTEGDLPEDGAEGGGSLEDGAGQVPSTGHQHLHEAWSIMRPGLFDLLEWAGYLLAGVVVTALILIVLGWLL